MPGAADRLQSFDALYAAHSRALHDYFLGRTNDPEVARDLLQEACIRLWRSLDSVGAMSAERQRAWLFTVARNLVIDHYRSRTTATQTRDALAKKARSEEPLVAPSADVDFAQSESLRAMDAAIGRLPEDLRTVLVLQVLGDRTSAEIGELLGRPAGTVRYQLALARRHLAEELKVIEVRS
jgi:RNA polymerase sigma-70 factor (ECF subfamily)